MKNRLSAGNKKLPRSTLIFNLPAIKTCPGATAECKKHCYALKAERMYPQVQPFRNQNFKLSKLNCFVELISAEINSRKVEAVRIHESGDFYNQEYVNKWLEVTRLFPNIVFYAYTKSWWLDFEGRPNNFIVLLSSDNDIHKEEVYNQFDGIASVEGFDNPLKEEEYYHCPGDCKICSHCWTKKEDKKINVLFKRH